MKKLCTYVLVLFLTIPTLVLAGIPTDLVPCGDEGQDACQTCHIYALVENVFEWFFGVGMIIVAIIIVYGGMRLVTARGNAAAKSDARKRIGAAIIGLILIGSAWVLVDLLIATLADEPDASSVFSSIECVEQPEGDPAPEFVPEDAAADEDVVPVTEWAVTDETRSICINTNPKGRCIERSNVPIEERTVTETRPCGSGRNRSSGCEDGVVEFEQIERRYSCELEDSRVACPEDGYRSL